MYTLCLQVELLHQFADVQVEVRLVLLHLCLHQVAVALGYPHLSLATPPVEDGQRDTEADVLLVHGVAPGILPAVGRLRQTEAQVDIGLQTGIGAGLCHGTLALQPAALHVLDVGAVLGGQQQGFVEVYLEVGHEVLDAHLQVYILLDAQIRTEFLHGIVHLDAGIHAVGLFGELVYLELQHLVLADGTDVVTAARIYI